ncbi:MAG: hypothetical protein IKR94_01475 [Bacteroidales bacterium]|nr:hypothetical protein [Bacteroidales bacterium]MBR4213974.1 hypothetical protein [Bacteroidales bacterium]
MENITDEKSQKSIKEIILVFSDIDVKITALNECSAEDFLSLNNYLKKFYKDAKVISGQTEQIYDIIAGDAHEKFFDELLGLQDSLNNKINMLKNKILKSIRGLEKMHTALNLVFVPLKNFNLNILTLNFLLVNLKLNVAYSESENIKKVSDLIDSITDEINKLKIILPKISESMLMVKNVTRLSSGKLIEIRKKNILDIDRVTGQINDSIIMLKNKQAVAAQKLPELTKRTQNYFDSVNKIITNLQYHDIIRQKMEHVQATHKNIIKELAAMDIKTGSDGKMDLSESAQQFLQIRDIAGIQVAQLINTNKEYQKAFAVIMRKFWDISEDMSVISQLSNEFVGNNDLTDCYFKDVEDHLKGTTSVLKRLIAANEDFGNEINTISQTIEEKNDKINEIQTVHVSLEGKIKEVLGNFTNQNDERGINRIIEEIKSLTDTISENLNDVTLFFRQAQNISKKLQEINHEEDGNQINDNLKELSAKIAGILESIAEHNEKIETVLIENSKLSLNLSSEIKSSVEQVKYYDFFEKIMLEIVTQLNSIYAKLDSDTINVLRHNKAENLKSLEDRYTMETERIVHRQALNEETPDLNDGLTPEGTDDDNDVEFF